MMPLTRDDPFIPTRSRRTGRVSETFRKPNFNLDVIERDGSGVPIEGYVDVN